MLIANQIVGAAKIARLVNLAAYSEVMVAVDNLDNVKALAEAAAAKVGALAHDHRSGRGHGALRHAAGRADRGSGA